MSELRRLVRQMTAEQWTAMTITNVKVHFVDCHPHSVFFLPAGWFVAESTANGQAASAITRQFLLKPCMRLSFDRFESMRSLCQNGRKGDADLEALMDVITIEKAKKA